MLCLRGKFSLFEQLWMQITFHTIWIVGAIGLWKINTTYAVLYILFVLIGILGLIVGQWICPRCPHIHEHNSCMQLPPSITKLFIRKRVAKPLTKIEKISFFFVLYGVFLLPAYWVVQDKVLAIPFILAGLSHYTSYFMWFCKRCLNSHCPQNMNMFTVK